ncbi:Nucleoporin NUP188 [Manis javanica]|nr:Nucleoporin NUP188 [Manis javanica]
MSRSSCPACARGDREHGAPSDVAAVEEKGIRHRRFTDSQPPEIHSIIKRFLHHVWKEKEKDRNIWPFQLRTQGSYWL